MSLAWGPRISAINEAFPPAPQFTDADVHDLSGKVVLVTGGASGIGFEFSKLVYAKNATIWIAGRSKDNADKAIADIVASSPTSNGDLHFLEVDLSDLTTIKAAVDEFLSKTSRLDLLLNNAGVMSPPAGSKSKQGYELQWGTNVLGHHLLTKHILPLLEKTAKVSPPASVRVLWSSSNGASAFSPKDGGILWDDINFERTSPGFQNFIAYGQSKAGNIYQAAELARRYPNSGVISVSLHPGGLRTGLNRNSAALAKWIFDTFLLYPPINGAYTLLYAAFSPEVTIERNGKYLTAWGRFAPPRDDIIKEVEKGADGNASKVWEWCETEVAKYD